MSVPSMVHRSGDTLVVRSVVSGDALFGSGDDLDDCAEKTTDDILIEDKTLPECKVKRNYSCGSCDFFTQNPRSFLYHLRDVHQEKVKIYECPNCLYASKHFQKLLRHTKMVHGSADSSEFPSRKSRKRPLQTTPEELDESNESPTSADESQPPISMDEEHEPTTVAGTDNKTSRKCSLCTFVAKTHAQLSKHEREEHIRTRFFRCTKCTYVTHIKARFTKHVKYHSMPMIKCDMCDFRTPYKWNLDRHCKNHNGKGPFRCSVCNFTADIKQSLTVHEMNHHVPPVGQAAGLGVGRRRNKVGASDTTAAEEAALQVQSEPEPCEVAPSSKSPTPKLKIPAKKPKIANGQDIAGDFVHPDDIVHHANGNVYIKSKCKQCNFKTAWDGEMAKHEERMHGTPLNLPKKRPPRPVPNLIPITPQKQKPEVTMSQKDMNEICARSMNSALKDFASLFDSEDVFPQKNKVPDLIPKPTDHKRKNTSFFDIFKAKITGDSAENLTCTNCGHVSKCLTEACGHQKSCGKECAPALNINTVHKLTSTRCQHCRQRCKSSKDLYAHLLTCSEAAKYYAQPDDDTVEINEELTSHLEIVTEDDSRGSDKEPHPMENKVFVWNNIEVPMDVEIDEPNQYEYVDDKQDDNISLDLSVRTQSPNSESSNIEVVPQQPVHPTSDKIPTHGNDISVAQHRRVFKCPHCTFWASTASRFHVHIVGHLNKKPFECSLCAYRSNWRWDITKHIKLKSVRDPAHENAKVLMTDETGRRNYTKYNKYLTEINTSERQETSGGMGTRPKHGDLKSDLPKTGKTDFAPTKKPLPALKAADEFLLNRAEKKRIENDGKKTLWQCKKCNFRDPSKDMLLHHVKAHYGQQQQLIPPSSLPPAAVCTSSYSPSSSGSCNQRYSVGSSTSGDLDEASVGGGGPARGQAPFRCGHCHQVSNWKHVIQRHCRLKHSGDIKVIVGSKSQEKLTDTDIVIEDIPEHNDVIQNGPLKCTLCPFSNDDQDEFQIHLEGHTSNPNLPIKCYYCSYCVAQKEDLYQHLKLHGLLNPVEYLQKFDKAEVESQSKRYKCAICPYVTNSKSQFLYHKQFHKPRNGQYDCSECNYNVSKRHLLHQHMKVHGISVSPQKQNGDVVDFEEITEEIEQINLAYDWQNLFEIPLVWVSKGGKFSKMYKCRYCPHVNLRKVNIQEHEKMHGLREKNPARANETEHRCPECNYVCNNAGVLSSHSKVHQGLYGTVHGLVDTTKSDDEQIRELGNILNSPQMVDIDEVMDTELESDILFFCSKCPARFFKERELEIHIKFHGARLMFICEHCSYTAQKKQHLQSHYKVHTKEYQDRTKELIESNRIAIDPENSPPDIILSSQSDVWIVDENNSDIEMEMEYNFSSKKSINVPLSGTDLFQQKSEAEANEKLIPDLLQSPYGNPNFVYPTLIKNGRLIEKRFKCSKCPSAFEKREQYNVHLGLHGSKQQYKCTQCDYSVRYYANFVQHKRKHEVNDAQSEVTRDIKEEKSPLKLELRRSSKDSLPSPVADEKKPFWCPMCPYTNLRKDAVDSHQKRHVTISGMQSNYTCQHCDYSVPQAHFLRDHTKLHFTPSKMFPADAFMACNSMKLSAKIISDDGEELPENMIFQNKTDNTYDPPLNLHLNNNNEGEKMFVNTQTGEVIDKKGNEDIRS